MAAAERNFSNPVEGVQPQWVFLAQAVFNTMSDRWDESHCGGGLRWQIFPWNSGYDYKNTVSNGCLFHLAARLARFTENNTYVEWAEKAWDWMEQMELIDGGGGGGGVGDRIVVFDGAFVGDNCSHITLLQWSYNAGLLLSGAAYLYDYTKEPIWEHRVHLLLNGTSVFFQDGIMFEAACQRVQNCNNDQRSFKAYLARFLGLTAQLVEGTREIIDLYLQTSAVYAARSCTGGTDGVTCGLNWLIHENDGVYGLGEQMSALEVIQNLRYMDMPLPYTAKNGGTSKGDINAGWTRDNKTNNTLEEFDITTGSKVGASFITAVIGVSLICGLVYLVI
jgi:mannan endo-1,6-alpha-mannosidase